MFSEGVFWGVGGIFQLIFLLNFLPFKRLSCIKKSSSVIHSVVKKWRFAPTVATQPRQTTLPTIYQKKIVAGVEGKKYQQRTDVATSGMNKGGF